MPPERPGRKPTDPRRLQVTFEFDSEEQGRRIRALGGGTYIKRLVQEALGHLPQERPITTELLAGEEGVELRVLLPRERLRAD